MDPQEEHPRHKSRQQEERIPHASQNRTAALMRSEHTRRIPALERIIRMLAQRPREISAMQVDETCFFDAERGVRLHHLGARRGRRRLGPGRVGIQAEDLEADWDFEITQFSVESEDNT